MLLNGEDNYVNNVIIFDFTCLGVLVNGAASLLDGVHSWNGGGVAIAINGSYDIQDRVVNCYLDYSVLEIVKPSMNLVQGNFFYNAHAVLQVGLSEVANFVSRDNIFSLGTYGGTEAYVIEASDGWLRSRCAGVAVEDDVDGWQGSASGHAATHIRGTRVRRSLALTEATEWVFELSGSLLFGSIDSVMYSVVLDGPDGAAPRGSAAVAPGHVAYQLNGTTVKVVTDTPVSATVHLEVAECTRSKWAAAH